MSPGLVGSLPQTLSQEEPQGKSGAGAGAWPDVLPDWDLLPWHPYSCRHVVARLLQRARGWERSPSGCPSTRCPWGGLAQPTHPSWGGWLTRPCCCRVPAAAHASRLCSTAPRGSRSHARSCRSSGLKKQARAPSLYRKSLLAGKGSPASTHLSPALQQGHGLHSRTKALHQPSLGHGCAATGSPHHAHLCPGSGPAAWLLFARLPATWRPCTSPSRSSCQPSPSPQIWAGKR